MSHAGHADREALELWSLGAMTAEEARAIEAHLRTCHACTDAAATAREVTEAIGLGLTPETPRTQVRARLMAAAAAKGRLARWTDAVAQFFDFGVEKARGLLDAVDDPDAWESGAVPGLGLMHFSGGPKLAAADCGLVRFPAGIDWPVHKHLGEEQMLILEGGLVEDGREAWREGAILRKAAGTQHAFKVFPERDCV